MDLGDARFFDRKGRGGLGGQRPGAKEQGKGWNGESRHVARSFPAARSANAARARPLRFGNRRPARYVVGASEVAAELSWGRRMARGRSWWRVAGLILVVLAGIGLALRSGMVVDRATAIVRAAARGDRGGGAEALVYLLAAGFTFLAVLLPLPAEAAALLNGTLFPPATAFVLTWAAAMLGAGASYEVGRWAGRPPAVRLFGADRLRRVERLVDRAGWPTLLALRLSPIMAFTALNWASGILALSRPVFYWTVAVGLVPGTYLFSVVPEVLRRGTSVAGLLGLAAAVMIALFGLSYARLRRSAPTS